ncbi:MAG: hypothetical protein HYW88_01280 [Candidatus Sungbacteria bacterium]|nr:hypothetical protein [Candidatus Sungbacteria bacterium]
MKKILVFSILLLAPALVFAATPALPDYEKEADLAIKISCDANKTSVRGYSASEYIVVVVEASNGKVYYGMVTEVYFGEVYFIKEAGEAVAKIVPRKEWDDAISKDAPNFLLQLNDKESDCKKSE